MEDFNNKSYEKRIEDIKNNLYAGGGAAQANIILDIMMSSFSKKEFTGASDISIDSVLSNISKEIKTLKGIVRNGGIVPIKMFENHLDFIGLIPQGLAIEVTKDNNPYKN